MPLVLGILSCGGGGHLPVLAMMSPTAILQCPLPVFLPDPSVPTPGLAAPPFLHLHCPSPVYFSLVFLTVLIQRYAVTLAFQ